MSYWTKLFKLTMDRTFKGKTRRFSYFHLLWGSDVSLNFLQKTNTKMKRSHSFCISLSLFLISQLLTAVFKRCEVFAPLGVVWNRFLRLLQHFHHLRMLSGISMTSWHSAINFLLLKRSHDNWHWTGKSFFLFAEVT